MFVGFPSVGFRPEFRRNATEHDQNPARSDPNFIVFRRIPTKSGWEPDRWEFDKNPIGSDRVFMKDVGFRKIRRGSDRKRPDLPVGLNLLGR
jgi:hypothetical protein